MSDLVKSNGGWWKNSWQFTSTATVINGQDEIFMVMDFAGGGGHFHIGRR